MNNEQEKKLDITHDAPEIMRIARCKAFGLIKNHHVAEDITQNALVKLSMSPVKKINESYIHSRVNWCYVDWIKEQERDKKLFQDLAVFYCLIHEGCITSDYAEKLDDDTVARVLRACVDNLPAIYRDVIILRYWHGLSGKVIGNRLGISEDLVRVRLYRGREQLRDMIINLVIGNNQADADLG